MKGIQRKRRGNDIESITITHSSKQDLFYTLEGLDPICLLTPSKHVTLGVNYEAQC